MTGTSDRIEPTVIAGQPGWLATRDSDGSHALLWMGAENQAVFVSGLAPISELTRVAES